MSNESSASDAAIASGPGATNQSHVDGGAQAVVAHGAGTTLPNIEKVVIAIHGIGSQRRSDTIRSVARRFGDREQPPLPVMPLGFFSIGKVGEVHVSRLDVDAGNELAKVGFAEVFWADIPRQVVKTEDTLEETKAWGKTVVSRAQAAYNASVPEATRRLTDADFKLSGGVVEEVVETVAVLEDLLYVFSKMGVFKFDLGPLLRDYVGDVQVVTEFKYYRDKIVARFHGAMAQILAAYRSKYPGDPEIYVVAHSEGTVVSFLGLLHALSGVSVSDTDAPPGTPPCSIDWIKCVRGFMTIGSPIDKHLVLWKQLWSGLDLKCKLGSGGVTFHDAHGNVRLQLPSPIRWRNYYDFGDPIGFELDTARDFLADRDCHAFEFARQHDLGFSRYLLPGKAHNDYWGDADVFGHFITGVVMPRKDEAPLPPKSMPVVGFISTCIPYLLAAGMHIAAVFILFKAVSSYLDPKAQSGGLLGETTVGVLVLALLLFCSTAAARLPRLVKTSRTAGRDDAEGFRWHALAVVIFAVGAAATWYWLPADLGVFLGNPLAELVGKASDEQYPLTGKAALLLAAAFVALTGWFAPRRPRWGRRALLACGVLVVVAMILGHIVATQGKDTLWPVLLAGLAFVYLWWLGMLVFDLAFVWHRYIRQSVAVQALAEWNRGRDAWPTMTLKKNPRE
jgi:hypothetical protein